MIVLVWAVVKAPNLIKPTIRHVTDIVPQASCPRRGRGAGSGPVAQPPDSATTGPCHNKWAALSGRLLLLALTAVFQRHRGLFQSSAVSGNFHLLLDDPAEWGVRTD